MDSYQIIFLILCGIATINSFLFAGYLSISKKGKPLLNYLLAGFLITVSIRTSKFLWVAFFEKAHPFMEIIWLICFVLMPIFLLAYFYNLSDLKLEKRKIILQFSGMFLIAVALVFLSDFGRRGVHVFLFCLSTFLAFVLLAAFYYLKKAGAAEQNRKTRNWFYLLSGYTFFTWLIHFMIIFVRYYSHTFEAVLFTVFVYLLIYIELKHSLVIKLHSSAENTFFPDEGLKIEIEKLMKDEKIILDPNLNLPGMAGQLKISVHVLSKFLNSYYNSNFNDFINRQRIEEAKRLLEDTDNKNQKIAALAFKAGFNSLSVFNSSFKKFTGKTPSDYQNENIS